MSDPEVTRTPDGRHLMIGGRRWRATDPRIPDKLRQELVDRVDGIAPRGAHRPGDRSPSGPSGQGGAGGAWHALVGSHRRRIRAAKDSRHPLVTMLDRRPESTVCPSEIARVADHDRWRAPMPAVREVAAELTRRGLAEVRQRGQAVDPESAKGPIRIAPCAGLSDALPDLATEVRERTRSPGDQ